MTEEQKDLEEAIPALDLVITFLQKASKDHPELKKYCFYHTPKLNIWMVTERI